MSLIESSTRRRFAVQLGQTSRLWRRVIDRELQPYGLTQATWLPLIYISRAAAPLHQKELADMIGLDASGVVRSLDSLQKQGLLERREGADRRYKEIHLTAAGQELVAKVENVANAIRTLALEGLTEPEIEQVSRLVDKVTGNLTRLEKNQL